MEVGNGSGHLTSAPDGEGAGEAARLSGTSGARCAQTGGEGVPTWSTGWGAGTCHATYEYEHAPRRSGPKVRIALPLFFTPHTPLFGTRTPPRVTVTVVGDGNNRGWHIHSHARVALVLL